MQLDIFSDTICPYCVIGKRRLDQALAERPGLDVQINWLPFQLDPEMPIEGIDRKQHLAERFGSVETAMEQFEGMRQIGQAEGIDFRFDKIARSTNTFESHRMVYFAHAHGFQNEMVDALFAAYFTEGLFLGDHEVLVGLAAKIGLDGDEVRGFLNSDDAVEAIRTDEAQIRSMGIESIPLYVINGSMPLSGLQTKETFLQFLDRGASAAAGT
jgi:predicted DsbA family dithiol-disulfide isomerase